MPTQQKLTNNQEKNLSHETNMRSTTSLPYSIDPSYSHNSSNYYLHEPVEQSQKTPKIQIENQFIYQMPDHFNQFIETNPVKINNNTIISNNLNNNKIHKIEENCKVPVIQLNNNNIRSINLGESK